MCLCRTQKCGKTGRSPDRLLQSTHLLVSESLNIEKDRFTSNFRSPNDICGVGMVNLCLIYYKTNIRFVTEASHLTLSSSISILASESAGPIRVKVERVFESFDTPRPIQLLPAPGDSGRNFLVLQGGKVLLVTAKGDSSSFETIMDISQLELIDNACEEGLLGIALHPRVNENSLFYAYHTLQNPKRTVLVEHKFSDLKTFSVDPHHQREILSIPQPYWNHNSGIPCFGP